MYNIKYKYIKLERSTNNRVHVKILLSKEVSVEEGLWLQFVLGDDHKRVFFNMLRFEHWKEETERFNVLFSEKYKFKRKKSEKK